MLLNAFKATLNFGGEFIAKAKALCVVVVHGID